MQTQNYVREFAFMFFARQTLVWGFTAAAVAIGLALVLFWPPSYQATGAIILKGSQVQEAQESLGEVRAEISGYDEFDFFSEMEIILSQDVARGTARRLAVADAIDVDPDDAEAIRSFASRVEGSLSTELVPRSQVISVSLTWGNPEAAETILDAVFEEYLRRRQAVFNPAETEQFFGRRVSTIREGLEELENRMVEITGGASVEQLNDTLNRNVELETQLSQQLNTLEGDLVAQEKYVDYLGRSLSEGDIQLFTGIDDLELGDFAQRIQDLLIQREELTETYTENSPPVQRADRSLQNVYKVFRREAEGFIERERATLETLRAQVQNIRERLAEIDSENERLYGTLVEARQLDRELQISEESYSTFARRYREAQIRNESNADRLFKVGIVNEPYASRTPVFPQPTRVLPLSVIVGFLVGLTLAFLIEFLDHSFKRPEDVETYTSMPYLFSIPEQAV